MKPKAKSVDATLNIQFKPGPSLLSFLRGRAKVWGLKVDEAGKRCAVLGGLGFDPRLYELLAELADMHADRDQPFVAAALDARRLIAGFEHDEMRRLGTKSCNITVEQTRDVLRQMIKDIKAADPNAAWSIGGQA